jgi:hypothetical protein
MFLQEIQMDRAAFYYRCVKFLFFLQEEGTTLEFCDYICSAIEFNRFTKQKTVQ